MNIPPEIHESHSLAETVESGIIDSEGELTHIFEAIICIRIARWRAKELLEKRQRESIGRTSYKQIQEMFQTLDPRYGYIIEPWEEQEIIHLYKNPGKLREKFRSQAIDRILRGENVISPDKSH